jgi:flagellar protein FlaG
MSNVSSTAAIGDPGLSLPQSATPQQQSAPSVSNIEDSADFRLVIEEDPASKSYIYKTVDRRTGEVIQQFPREQLLKLKEEQDYSAGRVIKTRA